MKIFAERLKELRVEAGLSTQQLAEKLGFTNALISRWERDLCEPSIVALVAVAKFFNVSADYLSGLGSVGRSDDSILLHAVYHPCCPVVADLHAALQERCRSDLLLIANLLRPLIEILIAIAFIEDIIIRFIRFRRFLEDFLDKIVRSAVGLLKAYDCIDFLIGEERALDSCQPGLRAIQKEHITLAEKRFRTALIEDDP